MVSTPIRRLALAIAAFALVFIIVILALRPHTNDTRLEPGATLRVGIDPSLPPFASIENNELVGFEIDIANALAEELNVNVHFVVLGFDSLYDALLTDQVDSIIAALVIDPARMDDVRYTRPYYDDGLMIISNRPIGDIPEALTGQALAFEFGSEADSLARRWSIQIAALERRPYERPEYAIDALIYGEADAALVDATSYHLYTPADSIQLSAEPVTSVPFAIGIERDRPNLARQLDQALEALQQSGELDRLIAKWF